MADWNTPQYLKFASERTRPALDLMARVPLDDPATVYDLGCGAGNVTALLAERWPQARIVGVDSSPQMLAKARTVSDAIEWLEGDIATWAPPAPADLLFTNAALQWLDDHEEVFPRLISLVRPGGVLAVQMPRNHREPALAAIAELARSGPWAAQIEPVLRSLPVAEPEVYYGLLAPHAARLEVWETIYHQVLEGENPVVEFSRSTALRPVLNTLDRPAQERFLALYAERMAAAYPRRSDGHTLYPFRRLFLVAVRGH